MTMTDAIPATLTTDPEQLRQALKSADAATLMLVLVQLTGDDHWLDLAKPHIRGPMSYHETMPEALRDEIRTTLFNVLIDLAQSGRPVPPIPGGALLTKMMTTAAGEAVSDDYVAMMRADLTPQTDKAQGIAWRNKPSKTELDAFSVVIIGAGMSGLLAAIQLQAAGIAFQIIEKNPTVGGTWFENSYPGCGVDTPNHFYSYAFEPNHNWDNYFSKRQELWDYFEDVANHHALREKTRFETEVVSALYEEASALWTVTLRKGDGTLETLSANAVISAVGILNRPKLPDIPGIETFKGPVLHTGKWDDSFDWRGKHIAQIGTGASGHQVGPTLAPDVESLTIYQRSPHWVVPNPNYFGVVEDGVKWVLAHVPYYARWYRFQLFWAFADGLHAALKIDPLWDNPDRSINKANDQHRVFMERHMRRELGEDSPLLAKVLPDYPPYAKRILIDNHWFQMLKRDNVELVTDKIARIVPEGIVAADGTLRPADAIICATGFQASHMLAPMQICGAGGLDLHQVWGPDDAQAYQGTMVPGFPNFFILLGPNTALAHGGNAIFIAECQMQLVMNALRELIEGHHKAISVRPEAHQANVQEVDDLHAGMVWSHKGANNWYRNPQGRVFAVLPYRLVDYWKMTTQFEPSHFAFDDEPV
jgi:4-hydroxyacetophenone monooxygenase